MDAMQVDLPERTYHNNMCYNCKDPITDLGRMDSRGEFAFCIMCFKCAECKKDFPSEVTTIKWNYRKLGPEEPRSGPRFPLHPECWEKIKAEVRCDRCSRPIWLPKVDRPQIFGVAWHPPCIVCNFANCQKRLKFVDGGELDSRDPRDVPDDGAFFRGNKPFCPQHKSCLEVTDLTSGIVKHGLTGRGGPCWIYKGVLQRPGRSEEVVALRTLRVWENPGIGRFDRENELWFNLPKSPYILELLGTYEDKDSRRYGVLPWMDAGDLSAYVRANPDADKVNLLIGAAKGLEHLHSGGIIHGDIKGDNILVGTSGISMLSDFGTARYEGPAATTHRMGTRRYYAPELDNPGQPKTRETDVFAFGLTIIEILGGGTFEPEQPISRISFEANPRYLAAWVLAEQCAEPLPGKRPSVPFVIESLCKLSI